jgi:hypothetical protein
MTDLPSQLRQLADWRDGMRGSKYPSINEAILVRAAAKEIERLRRIISDCTGPACAAEAVRIREEKS